MTSANEPPELCFVAAAGGSVFMTELLNVVADAVRRIGHRARTAVGAYPEPRPNTVYVVVPHEYFVVTPEPQRPGPELRRRTIGFCVEHPGTATFDRTAVLLPQLGGAVDINHDSTAELRRRGFNVEHFQLGYSPLWDAWGGDPNSTRDVDVTYLGTAQRRRALLLASYWRDLAALRVRLLTPPHEPMGPPRPDFLPGLAKHQHLARSRFLLNLHRERSRALEWVRVLEALCNGCVVLTEPSTDLAPLVAGQHLVVARARSLGALAAGLTTEPWREHELRLAGYEFVRTALDLPGSAKMLVELATSLARNSPTAPIGTTSQPEVAPDPDTPTTERPLAVDTPPWEPRPTAPGPADPARCAHLRHAIAAARSTSGTRQSSPTGRALFDEAPRAEVDVLVVQRPGESDPSALVADLLTGTVLPRRVLVGADGVDPPRDWRGCEVQVHEQALGRGYTRNRLCARALSPWLFVADGGMRASGYLLERMLEAGEEADVVHCPVADPVDGLVGAVPAEGRRLAAIAYLGCGYLVRRSTLDALGGWAEDPLVDGLEDHVFWRRVVAEGYRTNLVQQVLLHRMRPDPPERPVDRDPRAAWAHVDALVG